MSIPKRAQEPNAKGNTPLADDQFVPGPASSRLLTRRDLAARWACCPHTIARMNNLRAVRFNRRRLRYRIDDILAIEAAAVGK